MSSKKKRRRRQQGGRKKSGGTLMGMRSGFKNVASSVAGAGETQGKSSWLWTVLALIVIVAALAFFLKGR